ncbi:MAG: hypothetical protein MJY94_02160 [Bacteroidales bacterium]|nr:hypothetical protein [Bacteroidales bacterium]
MMKRLLVAGALALASLMPLKAQNPAAALSSVLSENGLQFDYSYAYDAKGMKINGTGHITAQNDAFRMTGNGLLLVCDGKTRWTVDEAAMECYIETVDASDPDLMANPALLVLGMDRYCRNTGSSRRTFKGRSLMAYDYEASRKGVPFKTAEFFFDGSTPAGVRLKLADGSVLELEIKGYKKAGPLSIDPALFTVNTDSLGSEYMITDLR